MNMLIPVGHFMGRIAAADKSESTFGIRYGDEMIDLTDVEFGVWALAHGLPDRVNRQQTTEASVLSLAKQGEFADPEAAIIGLREQGLLVETLPVGGAAQRFAKQHQLWPLGIGLGNTTQGLASFAIGMPDEPRAAISPGVFDVWAFGHLHPSLWAACEATAQAGQSLNETEIPDSSAGADIVLKAVLQTLPILLATDSAYIDIL